MWNWNKYPYTDIQNTNLDWIINQLKEVQRNIDGLLDEAKAYTDSVLGGISARMDEVEASIDVRLAANLATVNELIAEAEAEFSAMITLANRYTDSTAAALRSEFDAKIAEVSAQEVFNPIRGYYTNTTQAIADLYALHTTGTPTADEYDAAELTAAAYDALELTASEYDFNGKAHIN